MPEWFRSRHGWPMDDRWRVIAKRAGVPPIVVPALVWALLDHASSHKRRGAVSDFDVGAYAAFVGIEPAAVANVLIALAERKFIVDGRLRMPRGNGSDEERRYLISDRPYGPEWQITRKAVFERDGYTCQYCGQSGGILECDHIEPVAAGGSHEPENLATACFKCNRAKRDMSPQQWRALRERGAQ